MKVNGVGEFIQQRSINKDECLDIKKGVDGCPKLFSS